MRRLRLYLSITITMVAALSAHPLDAQLTTQAPPPHPGGSSSQTYPDALPTLPAARAESPILESDTQTYQDDVFTLTGHVVVTSGSGRDARRAEADRIVYHRDTGELTLTGHVLITATANNERILATHGDYNLKTGAGTLYDVVGSVGIKPRTPHAPPTTNPAGEPTVSRVVYTTDNPFLFTGTRVVKSGPRVYDIYDGSITSCLLPRPDWLLTAAHFSLNGDQARAHNSFFRLLNVPIFYLPYVTHPTTSNARQTGFLIPTIGQSSTKGLVLGEQAYLALSRSTDLIVGAEYYSMIGYAQNAAFRFRGQGLDFLTVRYNGVLDRRIGVLNQGGEDALVNGRRDFSLHTRAVANIEYLSSYVYREAFTDNFNQAVNSDILSTAYVAHEANGIEYAGLADRYQGIKLIAQGTTPQQQVRIFHAPALSISTTEHRLGATPIQLSFEGSADGLKRTQPNFATSGIVERFDFRPRIALPVHLGGWNVVPAVAARETVYTRSRLPPAVGQPITESLASLSRSALDFTLAVRPPVIERTFVPTHFNRLLGSELRHTVEPSIDYRRTTGVDNFFHILRFDEVDVLSNTNEVEYAVTQRLFRRKPGASDGSTTACRTAASFSSGLNPEGTGADVLEDVAPAEASDDAEDAEAATPRSGAATPNTDPRYLPTRLRHAAPASTECRNEEMISWSLAQKYFFDPNFGGAIQLGRRNIFETTLNLSGVAFLTEPRNISPLISRLRVRTSAAVDVEWDFDLDTGAKKFTSSNVYVDLHHGNGFTALSYARLDAPGRFYTQGLSSTSGVTSAVSDFNQLRFLIGYGSPAKPGLSVAANTGLDLKSLYGATSNMTVNGKTVSTTVYPALVQYATVQTSYNWNCCGLAVEYRKFELGSVRNENSYRFNFTLANIGAAGNLRRAERLF